MLGGQMAFRIAVLVTCLNTILPSIINVSRIFSLSIFFNISSDLLVKFGHCHVISSGCASWYQPLQRLYQIWSTTTGVATKFPCYFSLSWSGKTLMSIACGSIGPAQQRQLDYRISLCLCVLTNVWTIPVLQSHLKLRMTSLQRVSDTIIVTEVLVSRLYACERGEQFVVACFFVFYCTGEGFRRSRLLTVLIRLMH